LFAALAAAILLTLACDGSTVLSALPTREPFPTAEPIAWATLPVAASTFVMSPLFNVPPVPEDVLQPFAGNAPQWWCWVPVHPAARAGGESGGGFHYLVDLAPGDVLAYYRDALRQSGWAARMGDLTSGDFSLLSYDRDDAHADIYLSPHGASTLVSILVD
jgi:hypothetical protein